MSQFCVLINFAADSRQLITTETFLDTMTSVIYRLMDMHFEDGSSNEAIRLGLLAFSSSVFLQWRHLSMPFPHLTSTFKGFLVRLNTLHVASPPLVWLLMVGGVSVFEPKDDEWLKTLLLVSLELHEIDSWSKLQHLLNSIMWIGLVHDKPGKRIFDSTMIKRTSASAL